MVCSEVSLRILMGVSCDMVFAWFLLGFCLKND